MKRRRPGNRRISGVPIKLRPDYQDKLSRDSDPFVRPLRARAGTGPWQKADEREEIDEFLIQRASRPDHRDAIASHGF